MSKYFTVDTVKNSRLKELEMKMQLQGKYYEPIAEILHSEQQQKLFGNSMNLNGNIPTYENFILSEKADREKPNNLLSLLKKIADDANARKVYDIITGQRSEKDVKYIETHWARIERNIRKNLTRGVSYQDLADFIMKDLYEGENENVQKQIEQTAQMADLQRKTDAELDKTQRREARTDASKSKYKKQASQYKKEALQEHKNAISTKKLMEHKESIHKKDEDERVKLAQIESVAKEAKSKARKEKKQAKLEAEKELEKQRQRNIFVSPQKPQNENWGYNTPQDYINSTATTTISKKTGKKATPIPIPIEGKGVSTQRRKNLRFMCGGGGYEPLEEGVEYTKNQNDYVRLNKMMIDMTALNENKIKLQYVSTRNTCACCPRQNISHNVKEMIMDVFQDKFYREKYDDMSQKDKTLFLKFCDSCHINVGINSLDEFKKASEILLGEHRAGNSESINQLKEMIGQAIIDKQLSPKQGMKILECVW